MAVRPDLDCLVVGGGLGGLACAHALTRAGRSVHVLEAADAPGGRARTDWHRGAPVDRGFQVMFSSYRRAGALARAVGIPRRDMRPVAGGAVFLDGRAARRLAPGPAAAAFAGLAASDRARLGRLVAEVAARPASALLEHDDDALSAEALLRARGFSDAALEGFFRPLFGVVLQDRSLSADPGYFRFLLATMVRGRAVIPSDGLGMLAEWTSAAVRHAGGAVELGARVAALEADGDGRRVAAVRTDDGRALSARQVVLALDAPSARALLEPLDPATAGRLPGEAASSATAAFALRRPLYRGRALLLNADPADTGPSRVDLMCQTTNVTRPGAPEGPHILLAMRITTGGGSADGLAEDAAALARRWAPGFDWDGCAESLGVREHRFALYRPVAGVRRSLPGPRTALANVVLAGDLTHHPSIEGAVAGGLRAAGVVDALIP